MSGTPGEAADPFLRASYEILTLTLREMRDCISGLTPEALNRQPAGDDSNSIAVLANHSLQSTRSWLSVALGEPLPPRDRPSEFTTSAPDAAALLALVDALGSDCAALLQRPGAVDWSISRATHARPDSGSQRAVPAAWALLHAMEHLREHTGQMLLTRQLLEAAS